MYIFITRRNYTQSSNGHAPLAILKAQCETITAVGCIIAEIVCVDQLPIHEILPASLVRIDKDLVSIELPGKNTMNGEHA